MYLAAQNICMLVVGKEARHLVHCTESRIVLKTGQQEKLYPPTDVSVSQQCRPQLLSVKFENLAHNIFRNEKCQPFRAAALAAVAAPCSRPCEHQNVECKT